MNFSLALKNEVFLIYLSVVIGLLVICGTFLYIMKSFCGKEFQTVRSIYKGWFFIIPILFLSILFGRIAFIVFIAGLAILAFKEFARATGLYNDWWMTISVYVCTVGMALVCIMPDPRLSFKGWFGMFRNFPVFAIAFILAVPALRNRTKGQLQAASLAIVGFVYMGWMFAHLGFLANSDNPYGYILFLVFAVEINDISAFMFGKLFGKKKFRSEISPNKTWAGALGALGVSLLMPWLLGFSFPHFGTIQKVLTGLIVGIGGQLGDLSISFIKRDLGIKDMGAVIPGHGGILDRIDSLIYTAPLFFHMINWFYGIYGLR